MIDQQRSSSDNKEQREGEEREIHRLGSIRSRVKFTLERRGLFRAFGLFVPSSNVGMFSILFTWQLIPLSYSEARTRLELHLVRLNYNMYFHGNMDLQEGSSFKRISESGLV